VTTATATWVNREATAEELIPLIGKLHRENGVVLSIHGRSLVNKSVIELLKLHDFVSHIDGAPLNPAHSLELVRALVELNLGACSINIAALHKAHREAGSPELSMWLPEQLGSSVNHQGDQPKEQDVVLYGFGRIGRLLARILLERSSSPLGSGLNLRAVVVRKNGDKDLVKRASLLERDSVHGPFKGVIEVDEENSTIIANGVPVRFIYSSDPTTVDYTEYGIKDALLVDNTGRWRDVPGLEQHLNRPGISRVLLTAPGKGDMKNIVFGVNDDVITDEDKILSAASCTTNCLAPMAKGLNDFATIKSGIMTTIHAYTGDQMILDGPQRKGNFRRSRAGAENIVPNSTGAAKAIGLVLPELNGKLIGAAQRVPTPTGSLTNLYAVVDKKVTAAEVNAAMKAYAETIPETFGYNEDDIVSRDIVGETHGSIFDATQTMCSDLGDGTTLVQVTSLYDNENSYTSQMVRTIKYFEKFVA